MADLTIAVKIDRLPLEAAIEELRRIAVAAWREAVLARAKREAGR